MTTQLLLALAGAAWLVAMLWLFMGEVLAACKHDAGAEVRDRRRNYIERRLGLQPPPVPERRNKNRRRT